MVLMKMINYRGGDVLDEMMLPRVQLAVLMIHRKTSHNLAAYTDLSDMTELLCTSYIHINRKGFVSSRGLAVTSHSRLPITFIPIGKIITKLNVSITCTISKSLSLKSDSIGRRIHTHILR